MLPVTSIDKTIQTLDARIEIEAGKGSILIKNLFINNSTADLQLTYRFKYTRVSKSGSSSVSQSGKVAAIAGDTVVLSKITVSFSESDSCNIILAVFNGEKQVAQDALHYPH